MLISPGTRFSSPHPTPSGLGSPGWTSTQVWFGDEPRFRYGWLTLPADGVATAGVMLCPPMGEEGRAAHRTLRRLAEALAGVGIAALRFDYDGTGDSAGAQDDPDRVDAWLSSVTDAAAYLRDAGVPRVSAVGMRLGATLAATVAVDLAASDQGLESLVLWDPCESGRTFLREGEALFSFAETTEVLDPAYRHTPGFQYDQATARSMRRLDLPALPSQHPLADRLLVLSRQDRPQVASIRDRLMLEGERVTERPALDQADLLDIAPSDNSVPQRSLLEVVAWLLDGSAGTTAVPVKSAVEEHPVVMDSDGIGSTRVRERTMHLGAAGVFGIADEPVEAPAPGSGPRPWVVLVNVAAEHHIGPGRRWVEFSRRWAAMGIRTIRLDQSGVGDSPTHAGQLENEAFAPEWIDDMRQVVRTLSADGSPVLLVGLCSGAYSALEAALWERVAGIFAVNPRLTLYPAAKGTPIYTPDRRAGIVPARPFAALARHHRILAGALWRIYRQVAVWHAPYRVIRAVVRRGTTVRLIACHDDAQHFTEVAFWRPSMWRLLAGRRFAFEEDEVFDHSLLGRHGQEVTWQRATEFVAGFHHVPGTVSGSAKVRRRR